MCRTHVERRDLDLTGADELGVFVRALGLTDLHRDRHITLDDRRDRLAER